MDKELVIPETVTMDALDIIEKRDILFKRIMDVAIKSTSSSDWVDQAGKPYLQASGAEKVARRFAIKISDVVVDREDLDDENGRYYVYTTIGKASFAHNPEESIEAVGTCSSRDKFFGRAHGQNKAVQDVDITNIRKKSYTNFMGNAITRLLGIRNLTWEDLQRYGVTKNGKASVSYDKGASKAQASKQVELAETNSKLPYWTNDFNGKTFIHAKVGQHFSEEFLTTLGFKPSKKEGNFHRYYDDNVKTALQEEYAVAEEMFKMNKGGENDAS